MPNGCLRTPSPYFENLNESPRFSPVAHSNNKRMTSTLTRSHKIKEALLPWGIVAVVLTIEIFTFGSSVGQFLIGEWLPSAIVVIVEYILLIYAVIVALWISYDLLSVSSGKGLMHASFGMILPSPVCHSKESKPHILLDTSNRADSSWVDDHHFGKIADESPSQSHLAYSSPNRSAFLFSIFRFFRFNSIRNYNCAFAFASIGVRLETLRQGPYCFRIHGQIYHRIGPALPEEGQPPRYGQVYILDTSIAAYERAGNLANVDCNAALIRSLSTLLHEINAFAHAYKMLNEVALEENARAAREGRSAMPVRMVFETSNLDPRRYNEPTANEVAVVYVGEDGDVPAEHNLAVHLRSGGLRNIRTIDAQCDPLSYPVLFPRGELGWHPNMQKNPSERRRTRISQKEYYSSMIAVRNTFNPLHFAGKLYQQFLVDSYVKVEQNRLNYDRTHQRELRADTYRGLADYVAGDTDIAGPPGTRRIILPSSFPGSPRAMMQNYQDAMAIVSKYGKPDLFITFTCNPTWREIKEQLCTGQTASDRPDIVARVFHIKLQELFEDLFKRHVFGRVIAHISVMEWQKRGLPHCHILLTLCGDDKPRSAIDVDSIVQAVIPDPVAEPRLHRIVTSCMMHRPCGLDHPNMPCMVRGYCSKRFPKQFRETTNINIDGYPEYKRPNDGRTFRSGDTALDNRSVVPYNRYLSLRYNGHLNVEICAMIQAVKYMYKYVYKGPDRAALRMTRTAGEGEDRAVNEIDAFVSARYVCAPESTHRLLGFDLHSKSHTVYRLQVHLPEQETVFFQGGDEEEALRRAAVRNTTLTAYFELNAEHEAIYGSGVAPEGQVDARTLLYVQVPEHFTFNPQTKKWSTRLRQSRQIGRMYTANPTDVERYSLRILLHNRKGAKSFDDLKAVDGISYNSFKDAAKALGLLHDDSHYESCLREAAAFQMPQELRSLFSSLICFCDVTDHSHLWEEFKSAMADDYVHRGMSNEEAVVRVYFDISDRVQLCGVNLSKLISPPTDHRPMHIDDETQSETEHAALGAELLEKLNIHQRAAADDILLTAETGRTERHFFIDGPGGSGKTFLYTALYHALLGKGKGVVCVAWTEIAANLLPQGRTASSTFKLNIHDGSRTTTMKRESAEARALRNISVIFWDEISMVPKWTVEAVDFLLKDLMQNELPFGGKIMIVGGDFRQILPIVERGKQEDLESACVKNSRLWRYFVTHHLSMNMRVTANSEDWAQMLLRIGEGTYEEDENGLIELPSTIYCSGDLITDVFGEAITIDDVADLAEKAILAPKNTHVEHMNDLALQRMPEYIDLKVYKSADEIDKPDLEDAITYQIEHLNKLQPGGMPPHELKLKRGCIAMLLRNLDVSRGLCNGTRLIVEHCGQYVLGCRFATGNRKDQFVLIPRIDNYTDKGLPFRLRRRQFPIRLAFATTINKAQGQTLSKVGVYLPDDVFSHGQLYVALSRSREAEGVKVLAPKHKIKNIVYKNIFFNTFNDTSQQMDVSTGSFMDSLGGFSGNVVRSRHSPYSKTMHSIHTREQLDYLLSKDNSVYTDASTSRNSSFQYFNVLDIGAPEDRRGYQVSEQLKPSDSKENIVVKMGPGSRIMLSPASSEGDGQDEMTRLRHALQHARHSPRKAGSILRRSESAERRRRSSMSVSSPERPSLASGSGSMSVNAEIDAKRSSLSEVDLARGEQRLRAWLVNTILEPLHQRIKETNLKLEKEHASPPIKIGVSSVEALQAAMVNRPELLDTMLPYILPFLQVHSNQSYLVSRISELAADKFMMEYCWNSGGKEPVQEKLSSGRVARRPWGEHLPTDAELVFLLFSAYMDSQLTSNPLVGSCRLAQPFSALYTLKAPQRPNAVHLAAESFYIHMSSTSPPNFDFVFNDADGSPSRAVIPRGTKNFFYAVLSFINHAKVNNGGRLDRLSIGPTGLNIACVLA